MKTPRLQKAIGKSSMARTKQRAREVPRVVLEKTAGKKVPPPPIRHVVDVHDDDDDDDDGDKISKPTQPKSVPAAATTQPRKKPVHKAVPLQVLRRYIHRTGNKRIGDPALEYFGQLCLGYIRPVLDVAVRYCKQASKHAPMYTDPCVCRGKQNRRAGEPLHHQEPRHQAGHEEGGHLHCVVMKGGRGKDKLCSDGEGNKGPQSFTLRRFPGEQCDCVLACRRWGA